MTPRLLVLFRIEINFLRGLVLESYDRENNVIIHFCYFGLLGTMNKRLNYTDFWLNLGVKANREFLVHQ